MQDIIEEVDLRKRGVEDPILVHCRYVSPSSSSLLCTFFGLLLMSIYFSAGIGRTGTFLAVHTSLDRELKGETIDVKDTVARLRRQRIGTSFLLLSLLTSRFRNGTIRGSVHVHL